MKGLFKCAREDDERRSRSVKRSSLGMPPYIPNKYSRRLKRLSLGKLIRPKRIYNFCLLHACFVWYCYDLDTLSYTFDHIWTNLLTQCTPVPVPVFCCFSISVFPHIKSARKIPGKIQEKSAYRKLREEPGAPVP